MTLDVDNKVPLGFCEGQKRQMIQSTICVTYDMLVFVMVFCLLFQCQTQEHLLPFSLFQTNFLESTIEWPITGSAFRNRSFNFRQRLTRNM